MRMAYYILAALLLVASTSSAKIVDRIAAMVNDEVITTSDMVTYKQKLQSGSMVDDLLVPDEKTKDAILKDDKKLLDVMIDEKILDYQIRKENLSATVERVEQEIRRIASNYHLTQAEFSEALQQQGTSLAEYQDMIKSRIERQSLIDKAVTSKVKISDDDVMAYYFSQKHGTVTKTYAYTIADIIFNIDPSLSNGETVARERAQNALKRIRENNESFEAVAAKYSEGSNASNGGLLGTFQANEMTKEFATPITKMDVGEVSDIVKARGAFHILKLVDKKMIPDPELEKEKDDIRRVLSEQAYKKQFQFWLTQKRQESYIRVNI